MHSRHGILEGAILSSLWNMEQRGTYTNTVSDVYNELKDNSKLETRAYTTVKTVMDRLCEKKVLLRYKQGKKFFYRTACSKNDIVIRKIIDITGKYCNNDLNELISIIKTMNKETMMLKV